MPWLNYTRVEFLLPVTSLEEQSAARLAEIEIRDVFLGATATSNESPIFHGYWLSREGGWIEDNLVFVFADSDSGQVTVEGYVTYLLDRLTRYYEEAGSPQDAFWITQLPIEVFSP